MKSAGLILMMCVLVAAGCGPVRPTARVAGAADLDIAIETVGLQPGGGLPLSVRITVTNRAADAVILTLPRPLVPGAEPPRGEEPPPFPLLALFLTDAAGNEESPVYTDVRSKAWPKARTAPLAPGAVWSVTYALADFYLWGPCGPDAGGAFTRYFWRGTKEVSLAAALIFGENRMVRSRPVALKCNCEEWLFKKKP